MIDFLQTISMTSARQLLLSIVAITIGTALPAAAQQDSTQDLKAAAAALIAQRVQFYNKKDAAGIAAAVYPGCDFCRASAQTRSDARKSRNPEALPTAL